MIEFSDIIPDVQRAEFIKNSSTVAFSSSSNSKVQLREVEAFGKTTTLPSVEVGSTVVFAPDCENYLVFNSKKATCKVYTIHGDIVASIIDEGIGIENAIWAPDSGQVLTFSNFQIRVSIYSLFNGSKAYIKSPKYSSKGCAFSHDGKFMALAQRRESKDCIGLYFTKDWNVVNYFQTEMLDLCDLMWLPNNNFIVAWDTCLNYRFVPICPFMGPIKNISAYQSALGIKTVAASHNSKLLAVGSFDQKIRLFNALTWDTIMEIECKPSLISRQDVSCFKEEEQKELGRARSNFRCIETANLKIVTTKPVPNQQLTATPKQGVGIMEFSPDDNFLAFRNGSYPVHSDNMPNTVWVYDLRRLDFASIINFVKPVRCFKWSPAENLLCITTGTSHIYFWTGEDRLMTACDLPYQHPMEPTKVKWNDEGKRFLIQDKNLVCMGSFSIGNEEQ